MIKFFMRNLLSFIILICLLPTAFATQQLTLVLDWFANPDHAPLFVAQEFGFFKKYNLSVKIISPADPTDALKLVASGQADLGVSYETQTIAAINQGLPIIQIATLIATPLNCMVVRADSNIYQLKDLKGKTIGYSTPGADDSLIRTMLQAGNLKLSDVKLINVHFNLTQALLSHRVDAVVGMMRNFELLQMKLAGAPGRAFYPEEYGVPSYNELIIITNTKLKNDLRLKYFILALNAATQYLINHPEIAWQRFAHAHPELNNPLNHLAWEATLARFALRPAASDRSRYYLYAKYLQQQKIISKIPPFAQFFQTINYEK